jgi:hypothetical protein
MADPALLAALREMALRVCAYYLAADDWERAHDWAELAWALWEETCSNR